MSGLAAEVFTIPFLAKAAMMLKAQKGPPCVKRKLLILNPASEEIFLKLLSEKIIQ